MAVSFGEVAPYVGMLAVALFALWQARKPPRDVGIEAGDFALRQNAVLSQQLERADRAYRALERDYGRLVAWGYQVQSAWMRVAPGEPCPPMPLRNGDTPTAAMMSDRDEVRLRKLLTDRLSDDDIRTLAWDLGFDNLPDAAKGERVKALLDYVRQRRKVTDLVKWLADNRADVDLGTGAATGARG